MILPSVVKDRFAQDRRRGAGDTQDAGEALKGHLSQRWVSEGTTNFAGPLADWTVQGGFQQQTFPIWDEQTYDMQRKGLHKPANLDSSHGVVDVDSETFKRIRQKRISKPATPVQVISWSQQKYGISSSQLPLGQAAAVLKLAKLACAQSPKATLVAVSVRRATSPRPRAKAPRTARSSSAG